MNLIRKNTSTGFPSLITGNLDSSWFDMSRFNEPTNEVAVNIKENDKEFIIEMSVPGFKKENINVEVLDNKLKVFGEKPEELEDSSKFTRKEFTYNSFSRSFTLPKDINSDNIQGECENGILTLTISRPQKVEKVAKKIELK